MRRSGCGNPSEMHHQRHGPDELRWTDRRRGEEFILTTINVRLLPDGQLSAKVYDRPVGGGRGGYVSFAVPADPWLAKLIGEAASRARERWSAQHGPPK